MLRQIFYVIRCEDKLKQASTYIGAPTFYFYWDYCLSTVDGIDGRNASKKSMFIFSAEFMHMHKNDARVFIPILIDYFEKICVLFHKLQASQSSILWFKDVLRWSFGICVNLFGLLGVFPFNTR